MCQRARANIRVTSRQMIYAWQHNSSFGADSLPPLPPFSPPRISSRKNHTKDKAHKAINDHGQLARERLEVGGFAFKLAYAMSSLIH